jgi:hypothetical protein
LCIPIVAGNLASRGIGLVASLADNYYDVRAATIHLNDDANEIMAID